MLPASSQSHLPRPGNWHAHAPAPCRNPPEVATRLRLFLRSAEGGWQREVAVEFAYDKCQRRAWEPGVDFEGCVAEMKAEAPYWSNLGIIDLDFGPAKTVDPNFLLLVDGWPRHVSLKAQLQARGGGCWVGVAPFGTCKVCAKPSFCYVGIAQRAGGLACKGSSRACRLEHEEA